MSKSSLSGLIYIVIGIVILFVVFQLFQNSSQKTYPLLTDLRKDISHVNTLKIESTVTGLNITESEDEFFYAVLEQSNKSENNSLTLIMSDRNNQLTLEVAKQQKLAISMFNFSNLNSKLNIKVPKSFKGTLDVVSTTGSTTINTISLNSLEVETTTGGLKLDRVNSDKINIESTTGSIRINNVTADRLKAESTTGSIHVDSNLTSFDIESTTGSIHITQDDVFDDSKLTSSTGSIHLNLKDDPKSLHVFVETTTGSVQVKKTGYNMIQNSRQEQEFQFGDGATQLKVETTTGSFHFN